MPTIKERFQKLAGQVFTLGVYAIRQRVPLTSLALQ